MSDFWDVFPIIIIFPTIGYVFKVYYEYRLKNKLIDKGLVDEKIKYLNYNQHEMYAPSSLKWGLVCTLGGLALIITWLLPYGYREGEVVLGALLLAAGIGLLIYYFIAAQLTKQALKEESRKL